MVQKSLLFAIIIAVVASADIPEHYCKTIDKSCTFVNINLNNTHYQWQPRTDDPSLVEEVRFSYCRAPVITNNLCKYFPNVKTFYLPDLYVEEIKEDAFESCPQLEVVLIYRNKIKRFHPNTFTRLRKLKNIQAYENQITELDRNLFVDLENLELLQLSQNNITDFAPELLRNSPKLTSLSLFTNDLSELDVEALLKMLPNLKYLYFDDNNIACDKVVDHNKLLITRNVINGGGYANKIRYYPVQVVNFNGGTSFRCSPDISWMATHYKKENSLLQQKVEQIDEKMQEINQKLAKIENLEANMAKMVAMMAQLSKVIS